MTKFTFIDLFAGIGGFHAVLSAMGGECVYASEIDKNAASIYKTNWGIDPFGDLTKDANDDVMLIPEHDVLAAGFPCQPFSKSGAQRGMDETRGTLYWNILKIIQQRRPKVIFLENVRNLVGPKHIHEWNIIIETLRNEGYRVSDTPAIFSPHLLPPSLGGRPQIRERVFITATLIPDESWNKTANPILTNDPIDNWNPKSWCLESDLPLDSSSIKECELSESEHLWIDAWDDFVKIMLKERNGEKLPGFPLWADYWMTPETFQIPEETPTWKRNFINKNMQFYSSYKNIINTWTEKWKIYSDLFPASRRKLEWQAQDTPSLWDTIMHLRPSGIRAKAPSYTPALVAITQTTIVGSKKRRITPREAARLQGFPDSFSFENQKSSLTYRQLGNGISIGAVWYALKRHVERDQAILKITAPELLEAILASPESPDEVLAPIV